VHEHDDGVIDRFVSTLKRRIEPADPAAVARVVRAARSGEQRSGGGLRWMLRPRLLSARALGAVAVAATVGGLVLGGALDSALRGSAAVREPTTSGMEPLQLPPLLHEVTAGEGGERPVPVQFVLVAGEARRVTLVGDFNGWDPGAEPLRRDAAGIWSATVTLPPGRHSYAFIVDDSIWTPDPRVPGSRSDEDFGRPNSVVVVGGM
jgi:hypothetical protein